MKHKFLLLLIETFSGSALALSACIAFVILARSVLPGHLDWFDNWFFDHFAGYVSPTVNRIILFVTFLGSSGFLFPANCALVLYFLLIRKDKWNSITSASVALSSLLMMLLLKEWFTRPRPSIPLLEAASGYSFPSGHAMSSVTFYGLLIFFIWLEKNITAWIRIFLSVILATLILLIGISRIYLKVHYASDVLGGFLAGYIWLSVSLVVIRRIGKHNKLTVNQ